MGKEGERERKGVQGARQKEYTKEQKRRVYREGEKSIRSKRERAV